MGIAGLALMGRYGNAGFIVALPLMWGAQRIRLEHDREWLERCKGNSLCMAGALAYYVLVLAVLASMMLHHHDPMAEFGFAGLILAVFLPIFVGMLSADYGVCLERRQGAREDEGC